MLIGHSEVAPRMHYSFPLLNLLNTKEISGVLLQKSWKEGEIY